MKTRTCVLSSLMGGAVVLSGCFPSNHVLREKLESRAKFDMSCQQLEFMPLEETSGRITTYGVTGCGRRLTYVLNANTQSWVLNGAEGRLASPVPVDATPSMSPAPPHS